MKKSFIAIVSLLSFSFAGYSDNIYVAGGGTVEASADHTPAQLKSTSDGTAHLIQTGFVASEITPTLTVTATTYTPNTIVGGLLTFSNVLRSASNSSVIKSLAVIDSNSTPNNQPLALVLFDTPTPTGTYSNHATFSINASDISHVSRVIPIGSTDYTAAGTTLSIGDPTLAEKVIHLSGTNTSCSGVLIVTSGTATMSGTNTMAIKLGVKQN